ncbi:MAG: hypothetical protein WC121_00570 [Candidatus Kapaibacterium sp.]
MTITEPESAMEYPISLRCNGDSTMLTLYDNCVECIKALGLKATYYGREAGGKTLALYETDPPINDATGMYSCQVNYTVNMTAFIVDGDLVSYTFPLFKAKPIDKLIILPKQSWNPIVNHRNFIEALNEYLETHKIEDDN